MRLGFSVLGGGHKLGERVARLGSNPLVAVGLLVVGLGVVAAVLAGCTLGLGWGAACAPPPAVLRPVASAGVAMPAAAPAPTPTPTVARVSRPPPPAQVAAAVPARPLLPLPGVVAPVPMSATPQVADDADVAAPRPRPAGAPVPAPAAPPAPAEVAPVDVDPEPADVDPEPGAAGAALRVVAGDGVNVRAGPATDSDRLFALPGGAPVTIAAREQGWVRIVAPDGRSGWIYEKYLLMPP